MIEILFLLLIGMVGLGCWSLQKIGVELKQLRLIVTPPTYQPIERVYTETPPPITIEEEKIDPESKVVHGRILEISEEEAERESVEEREFVIEQNEIRGRLRG